MWIGDVKDKLTGRLTGKTPVVAKPTKFATAALARSRAFVSLFVSFWNCARCFANSCTVLVSVLLCTPLLWRFRRSSSWTIKLPAVQATAASAANISYGMRALASTWLRCTILWHCSLGRGQFRPILFRAWMTLFSSRRCVLLLLPFTA